MADLPQTTPPEIEAAALAQHIFLTPDKGCIVDGGDHWLVMVYGKRLGPSRPLAWKSRPVRWVEDIGQPQAHGA